MANRKNSESGGESELLSALEQLSSSRTLRFKPVSPLRVAVLALDRYLVDARAAPDSDSNSYSYDVTITDGTWRVKCWLAPGLNRMVQVNSLRCGSRALIAHLSLVHDETRLRRSCVCIEEARSDSSDPDILLAIKDPDAIRWWTHESVGSSVMPLADVPLQYNRRHYLSLWNNEDPHGALWLPFTPPPDVAIDVSKISLLGDLDVFLASSRRPFPLLVRVLHRSRLRYYGKPGQNIDFPFQAYFEVADQSGVMSMVLWNDLCPEWYQRLVVGSVLYLQHYKLKRSYQNRSRPQLSTLPLISFSSTEICLNPRSPSAVITVIPPKSVQPQWSLPEVTYNFSTRCEVESLARNQACDIIGLVTYVSRVERIRNRANTVPEKFWTYRWVHAVDGTSDSPFILEIFASSQPEIFNNISPMTYLVCTHMRVCRETGPGSGPGSGSGSGSALYLTSSTETQLFVTGCHRKQPYVSDPKVKAFIQWTKTLKDSVVLRKTTVGGQYCYPPPPPTFTPNTTSNGASEGASPSLMAVGDLRKELESLQYREHRRVAVQGHITAVQYHRWPPEAPHTTPQSEQRPVEHDPVGVARGSTSSFGTGAQRQGETSSASSRSEVANSPKRRRVEQGVQRQYWTRAKRQLERQVKPADLHEDEETKRRSDEEDSEGLSTPSPQPADNSETGSPPDTQQSPTQPVASWESSAWPLLKQDVKDHVRCASLDCESVPEKFRFDDRDVLLHRVNLSPAKWSPDLPSDTNSDTHTPVNFTGYLTLTLLGLNQQAAVDSLFLPVFCAEDPRAVGTSYGLHDNTLMSCLSTGRVCTQANFSPETLLSSASALEDERVVCVLDVCLLGENRLEMICSKVYRTADIITPV
ncbi:RPA-related protein RADX [Pangasianodon hypophthalmus]|uniref:RPA-related protein RADX n=1 Tax=Pangasianodon hypophthalmus TaxID=310915 RepID=UPI002306ECEA|nr:RPA-related protein RADX [Pangasianodon hypophthalmus]XP_053086227.1 RPA-related protein RADX [Pangasianodon hypophthalmus]XP_053086228.1 RPA-related protein RADX [Pangasianodon hypophthalmus]